MYLSSTSFDGRAYFCMNLIPCINKAYDDMMTTRKGDCCSTLSFPEKCCYSTEWQVREAYNVQYQPLHEASPTFDPDEFDTSSSAAFASLLILF